ncbi:MAG: type II toxin-antitoxin system VapC family toxin [Acidobacteriota bacterium]
MVHLDTSFLIRALVPDSEQDVRLRGWLRAGEPLAMSAIGWAEFLCGPIEEHHLELVARFLPERVPFLDDHATLAARLFNLTGRRRGSLMDCMIAATAVRAAALLATANPRDFSRFESAGLRMIPGGVR